ncbi:hypothetical protein [Candidatus Rickettsia kedanie]|uniref:Uncharacterized protein n=1 Tax=Candidatus Rickettsia kedanie TaxID=3115352 RepID=A0ABP9TX73_9RICK
MQYRSVAGSTDLAINLTIGSMSGVVKGLNITIFNNATNINITVNGSAGGGNIPPVNDYSALQQVSFTQMGGGDSANSINLNINPPMTLNSTFYTSAFSETINVNDDVIITQPTKASDAGNMNFNIAGDKSLTLSAPNSIQDGTGAGRVRFTFTGANSVARYIKC